jgi:AcrR family transcriptional regulator
VDLSDPRAAKTRRRVLEVTGMLLVETGIQTLTMETVAKRAQISRSTLYRHWPQLPLLIADAVEHARPASPRLHIVDPIERLSVMIEGLGDALRSHPWGPIAAALAEGGTRDRQLGELHARYTRSRRRPAISAVKEAQRLGIISADIDPDWLVDVLAGPLYYQHLVVHRPMTAEQVRQHLERTFERLGIMASTSQPVARSAAAVTRTRR